jgi:hypothetical protein
MRFGVVEQLGIQLNYQAKVREQRRQLALAAGRDTGFWLFFASALKWNGEGERVFNRTLD